MIFSSTKKPCLEIAKWATELSEHTINFGKRLAIKYQVLADFVVDWTSPSNTAGDEELIPVWEIRCDEAWGCKGAGIAAIVTSPAGVKLRYAARLDCSDPSDRCTNNTTEYEVLLLGLRKVRALGASNFLVKCERSSRIMSKRRLRPKIQSLSSTLQRYEKWKDIFGVSL
jgi:hypothetical protein